MIFLQEEAKFAKVQSLGHFKYGLYLKWFPYRCQ